MRVVTRHRPSDADAFAEQARAALLVLAEAPGFRSGEIGRSPDEPEEWVFTTRWADPGSMRRGLGSHSSRLALAPVMVSAAGGPSVYEVLHEAGGGLFVDSPSARGT